MEGRKGREGREWQELPLAGGEEEEEGAEEEREGRGKDKIGQASSGVLAPNGLLRRRERGYSVEDKGIRGD